MKVRMEDKNLKALSLEDLDGIAGGAGYTEEEWAQWTRDWKDYWIYYYGDARCGNCGQYLDVSIESYNKDMAYNVYMNNAFKCSRCGQVMKPVKGWK